LAQNASTVPITNSLLAAIDSKDGSEFTSPVLSASGNCILWKRISTDGVPELSLRLLSANFRDIGGIHRADVASDGREANAGPFIDPNLFPTYATSSNCQHLVWISEASNLVSNSKLGRQIFWRDRAAQIVLRIPVGANDDLVPRSVQLSTEGRYVTYTTENDRVFVYDTLVKKLDIFFDKLANDDVYSVSDVSTTGTFVVASQANSLYLFDANGAPDVFVCSVLSPSCSIASVLPEFYATRFIGLPPTQESTPSNSADLNLWRVGGPLFWGVATITGLFVLGIIIAGLLLKCGFFKRKSASEQGYSLVSKEPTMEDQVVDVPITRDQSSSSRSRSQMSFSSDSKEKVN
jgi:hypothetical protein